MENKYLERYLEILNGAFEGYKKQYAGRKIGVLVSGGIDSSVIAALAVGHFPDIELLSLQSEKSVDDDFVEVLGRHLGKKPVLARVTRDDLVKVTPEIADLLEKAKVVKNPVQIALASVYYFLFKEAKEQKLEVVFTGQGPDILLAGYHKYRDLSGDDLKVQIKRDLPILETDKKRDTAMAQKWGLVTENPYLTKEFVDFALSLPSELLVKDGVEKYLSRIVGMHLGLPKLITERPKQAMQYSTGVQKLISK